MLVHNEVQMRAACEALDHPRTAVSVEYDRCLCGYILSPVWRSI